MTKHSILLKIRIRIVVSRIELGKKKISMYLITFTFNINSINYVYFYDKNVCILKCIYAYT